MSAYKFEKNLIFMKLIVPITTFSSAGNQLKGLLERPQHRENLSLIATTGTYNGYKAL